MENFQSFPPHYDFYMYGLAKMSMTWPAAGSLICRLRGTKNQLNSARIL